MKCFFKLLTLSLIVLISSTSCLSKKSTEKAQILIVDGFSNHDWKKTTAIIQHLLEGEKDIEVTLATVPPMESKEWATWLPKFKEYKCVIQNTNDINNGFKWPPLAKKSFEKYMYEGGSMLVFHSANNAFPQWQEYNKMIGLGWRKKDFGKALIIENQVVKVIAKGDGGNTGHGKRRDVLVHKLVSHPINNDYPDAWRAADLEVYRYARGPAENLTVLSYGKDEQTAKDFPIEWLVQYGEGEIYTSTQGHYWHGLKEEPKGVQCVAFQTSFIRALRYLSNLELKSLPKNFPNEEQVSLRPLEQTH